MFSIETKTLVVLLFAAGFALLVLGPSLLPRLSEFLRGAASASAGLGKKLLPNGKKTGNCCASLPQPVDCFEAIELLRKRFDSTGVPRDRTRPLITQLAELVYYSPPPAAPAPATPPPAPAPAAAAPAAPAA